MTRRRKKAPRPKPTCKICEATGGPWTKEDAYPEWMRKRIHEYYRALPLGSVDPGWEQGSRVILKPVCQRCQRRLNTMFETPANPLIKLMMDGSVISLSSRQQVILAGWFFKTAVVLTLARQPGRLPMPPSPDDIQRLRFLLRHTMKHGTPPPDATVRLAYLSHEPGQPVWPPLLPSELSGQMLHKGVSILSVPRILCETVTGWLPGPEPFINATKHDYRFIRIWPLQIAAARWPPRLILGVTAGIDLRKAWGHPTEAHSADFAPLNFPRVTDA